MRYFRQVLFVFFLLNPCFTHTEEANSKKTVCLNMIVKNESHVITRCLATTLPLIDYWVIVDTGSTDGTQLIIKDFMKEKGIQGELFERPWVNFGHNRTEALNLAKGKADYVLIMDADDELVISKDFKLPALDADHYYLVIEDAGTRYSRTQLINNKLPWLWVGVLHEYLGCAEAKTNGTLANVVYKRNTDGARSKDPNKFLKDAQILETALKEDPTNSRNVFYLAQSYRDADRPEQAIENYEKRASMGGWGEEVFWSLLMIAVMKEELEKPEDEVISSYTKAFQSRPSRAEPLYYLSKYYRDLKNFEKGYRIAKIGMSIPVSKDILFVQPWIYHYGIPLETSICAYWSGKYEECLEISENLLKRTDLPPNFRECVELNAGFARGKILEQINTLAIASTSEKTGG